MTEPKKEPAVRLYHVVDGDRTRLIEGPNPARVLNHCAGALFVIRPAKPYEVAALLASWIVVERVDPAPAADPSPAAS